MPDISLVMPAFRRPGLLRQGLDWLARQTLAHDRFEVLVVDDSGPGNYAPQEEVVRAARADFAVRYFTTGLPGDVYGVAVARNIGIRMAAAPVIAFTDDDCLCHPSFLEEHLRVHREADRVLVTGYRAADAAVLTKPLPLALEREKCRREFDRIRAGRGGPGDFKTGNASVKKIHLEEVGLFNEELANRDEYGYTDRELAMRLLAAGLEMRMNPDAAVWVIPPEAEVAARRAATGAKEKARRRFKRIQRRLRWKMFQRRVLALAGVDLRVFPWPGTTRYSDAVVAGLRAGEGG
jgi:glycosyltransferase involved in cell wall biosynthesis